MSFETETADWYKMLSLRGSTAMYVMSYIALWFYICSEHRGYRGMSGRTQAFCRTKLPCSGRWEKEGPVLLRFRMLNLMLGRSRCLLIAVNQLSCHLKGLKYKKFQWQSWSGKPRRAVGVGNSRKLRAPSSTPSTGSSAGLNALQNTKFCYSCQALNHHSSVV